MLTWHKFIGFFFVVVGCVKLSDAWEKGKIIMPVKKL
jgi:hypothetical protein